MKRFKNIDILKFIGLFCIILAHVSPPPIVFQLRNFDVILMIMISTYLYFENKNKITAIKKYTLKRFKRLVIPTYIFLIIFFVYTFIIENKKFKLKTIISSFLLHEGIGYVWVIRIYLITAILLPIAEMLIKKINFKNVIFINIIVYILHEILCYYNFFKLNILFEDILAYLIPCLSIIVITYWLKKNKKNDKRILLFSIINLIFFVALAIIIFQETGEIKNTNYAKYPFRLYYLSYSFGIIGILLFLTNRQKLVNVLYNKFVEFISKSSLWIYLWHILFIYTINFNAEKLNWGIKYITVLIGACSITYIQNKIIDKLEKTKINKEILKIFRG